MRTIDDKYTSSEKIEVINHKWVFVWLHIQAEQKSTSINLVLNNIYISFNFVVAFFFYLLKCGKR